jgi:hypothetical protein
VLGKFDGTACVDIYSVHIKLGWCCISCHQEYARNGDGIFFFSEIIFSHLTTSVAAPDHEKYSMRSSMLVFVNVHVQLIHVLMNFYNETNKS